MSVKKSPAHTFGWVEMFHTYHRQGDLSKKPNYITLKPDGNISAAAGGVNNVKLDTVVQIDNQPVVSSGTKLIKTTYAVTWRPVDKGLVQDIEDSAIDD